MRVGRLHSLPAMIPSGSTFAFVGMVIFIASLESFGLDAVTKTAHHLVRDRNIVELDVRMQHHFFAKEAPGIDVGEDARDIYSTNTGSSFTNFIGTQEDESGEQDGQENTTESVPRTGIRTCSKQTALLKVFMYDLPSEFHFGMIDTSRINFELWPRNSSDIPRYPGGLNQQHSPEYWLTLDLIFSVTKDRINPCTAIRVQDPKEADIFFVPFFSSLSYNRFGKLARNHKNVELQKKLINYLVKQDAWKRDGGKNHVIVMHHPNSLHVAREQLRSAMFVVADFGRYPSNVANLEKDIVAPYKHVIPTFQEDLSTYESRPILLFFQGAVIRKEGGVIRQKLYELIKDEEGVQFGEGKEGSNGIRSATEGMRSSKFCLHLAGDTPSSNRLFDAIASHCVPVIISPDMELPYEDELDYSEFCVFVRPSDALKGGFLMELLRSLGREEWTSMWRKLKKIERHFEYQHPSIEDDAVQMIWRSISHRLHRIKHAMHRAHRYSRSQLVTTAS